MAHSLCKRCDAELYPIEPAHLWGYCTECYLLMCDVMQAHRAHERYVREFGPDL